MVCNGPFDWWVGGYLHGTNHYQTTMPVGLYVQGRVPASHKLSSTFCEETPCCGLISDVTC